MAARARDWDRCGPLSSSRQIAVAVAVLPVAVYLSWQLVQLEVAGPGFAAEEFVVGMVVLGDEASAVDSNRIRATATRARRRVWRPSLVSPRSRSHRLCQDLRRAA